MLKAVIFDMDGVIVDSEDYHASTEQEVLRNIGINVCVEELKMDLGKSEKDFFRSVLTRHRKTENIEETIRKLIKEKHKTYLKLLKNAKPVPGAIELVEKVRAAGVKTAIATSSIRKMLEIVIENFNLEKYLDAAVCIDDVKKGKPEPDLFLEAAKRLSVQPNECVVIEDAANGIEAAKRAGMKSIGFMSKSKQDFSKADLVVSDLRGITIEKISRLF
ncbi:MAG: phosphatase [Candidatus Aenigmarchaeota archaeon ex4484_14]|nr:MAG: phosphatase [Candidatus Aenigmarchaeota archaeon ex4484_14]